MQRTMLDVRRVRLVNSISHVRGTRVFKRINGYASRSNRKKKKKNNKNKNRREGKGIKRIGREDEFRLLIRNTHCLRLKERNFLLYCAKIGI